MAVEPKMERKEISTTAAGFDFAIEFRQLLAPSGTFARILECLLMKRELKSRGGEGARENAKIAPGIEKLYEGTKPPIMRRYGESDDKTDEVI